MNMEIAHTKIMIVRSDDRSWKTVQEEVAFVEHLIRSSLKYCIHKVNKSL